MDYKDTVMTSRDAVFDPIQDQLQRLLIAQAEISFKAGFNEALNTVVATREYDEGKEAGMKEVVERIERGEWEYSLETYRWLKFLLAEFKHRPTIGDASDIDWEAHFAKQICNQMGQEAIKAIRQAIQEVSHG